MTPAGPGTHSLDDEVLLPMLERVHRGTITVKDDEYGRPWYHDDGRQCSFTTYLLEVLTQLGYIYWDSMVGEVTRLRVRQDGIRQIKLDDKGHRMLKRLREQARSAEAPSVSE